MDNRRKILYTFNMSKDPDLVEGGARTRERGEKESRREERRNHRVFTGVSMTSELSP